MKGHAGHARIRVRQLLGVGEFVAQHGHAGCLLGRWQNRGQLGPGLFFAVPPLDRQCRAAYIETRFGMQQGIAVFLVDPQQFERGLKF